MAEPGEFLGVVARAELRSASGDWAEAAALWGQVTAGNPVKGDYWARRLRTATSWPDDYRTWIAPDIYAPPTFAAFSRNDDPAREAILNLREQFPGP